MKRWQAGATLMLGLMVGGLISNQAGSVMAAQKASSEDVEDQYNKWSDKTESADYTAVDYTTGKKLQVPDSDFDNKTLFKNMREAYSQYGFNDHISADDFINDAKKIAEDTKSPSGVEHLMSVEVQAHKQFDNIKGYKLVALGEDKVTGTQTLFYVPTDQAEKYTKYSELIKMVPGMKVQTFSNKDDEKTYDDMVTGSMAFVMALLYGIDPNTIPGAKSDDFPNSSSSSSSSESSAESSSATSDSSAASSATEKSDMDSTVSDSSASPAEKKADTVTDNLTSNAAPASAGTSDDNSSSSESGSDSDLTPNEDIGSTDSNDPSDGASMASSGDNGGNSGAAADSNAATPAAGDNGGSSEQTPAQVQNSDNNQTLPQTGSSKTALAASMGLIFTLTGAIAVFKRKKAR